LWLVPEEPGLADVIGEQRELLSRLRAVAEAKDAENQVLRAELDAARERGLGLRLAKLERTLRMDSTDSGTPTSKEPIGARERRRAERQESERERRKDRPRGGQPGHLGGGWRGTRIRVRSAFNRTAVSMDEDCVSGRYAVGRPRQSQTW
jgi:hypothetical protein